MTTRLTVRVGAAALALAFAAAPAFAADTSGATTGGTTPTTTTPTHHRRAHAHVPPTHGLSHAANQHRGAATAVEPAVADLNAQSLAAAQAGQTFTPPGSGGAAPAPAPAAHKGHHKNM